MFGVLVVIFGGHRIAGALRVARELDVFFRDMRGGAANLNVGAVRLVDPRQRILAFAVGVVAAAAAAAPHAFLTVSHDVPVRRPFAVLALPRRSPPIALLKPQDSIHKSMAISLRGRTCRRLSAPMVEYLRSLSR